MTYEEVMKLIEEGHYNMADLLDVGAIVPETKQEKPVEAL